MSNFRGTKCEFGYIDRQKVFQGVMLLLYIAIGIGIFLLGLFITGVRANVFTVLAILMVLPGAKRVIALVVMLPRKSVDRERYDKMTAALSPEGVLLTDYVFTSSDKIMHFDFVVVQGKNIMGIPGSARQDVKYMTQYLQKGVDETASGYRVRTFASDDEFFKFYEKMTSKSGERPEGQDAVVKYLKILAV